MQYTMLIIRSEYRKKTATKAHTSLIRKFLHCNIANANDAIHLNGIRNVQINFIQTMDRFCVFVVVVVIQLLAANDTVRAAEMSMLCHMATLSVFNATFFYPSISRSFAPFSSPYSATRDERMIRFVTADSCSILE